MKKFILVLLLLLIACTPAPKLALPTPLAQSMYYVSTSGSDSNTGTIEAPLKTIGKVNSLSLKAGDSVLFKRGGTWMLNSGGEAGSLVIASSGVTYGAYGAGNLPVFNGANMQDTGTMSMGIVYIDKASYITVENLDIYNSIKQNVGINNAGNSNHITIQNCVIRTNRTSGYILIYVKNNGVQGSTNNIVVRGNHIYDSKWNGMRITGGVTDVIISGNEINNILHNGIDTYPSNKNNSSVKIYGNNIHAFGGGNGAGVYLPGCTDCEVYDNDIHDVTPSTNDVYGIKVGKVSALSFTNSNVTVHDNRIWNVNTSNANSHWGWGDSCKNCSFTNNLVCASAGGYFSGVTQSGNKVSASTAACSAGQTVTSVPTVTFTPTPTKTAFVPSVTAIIPTRTYTSTPTKTATFTPTWTYTRTPTLTPTRTTTRTPTITIVPTLTPTATSTPTITPSPTQAPLECVQVVWDRGLNLRETASMFNPGRLGFLYDGTTFHPLSIVEKKNEGTFAQYGNPGWILMHSVPSRGYPSGRTYAISAECTSQ